MSYLDLRDNPSHQSKTRPQFRYDAIDNSSKGMLDLLLLGWTILYLLELGPTAQEVESV